VNKHSSIRAMIFLPKNHLFFKNQNILKEFLALGLVRLGDFGR